MQNQKSFCWGNKSASRAHKYRAGHTHTLKMWGGTWIYSVFGIMSFILFLYSSFGDVFRVFRFTQPSMSFVQRNGSQFMVDGKPLYVNGWNSYWLMAESVDYSTRPRVRAMLKKSAQMGLSVCRTWAFNDGGYNALQLSPGKFDENAFKALDYVIVEARRHGIRIIFCLVNNLNAYGGKGQYVQWAREAEVDVGSSNDSFFYEPTIQGYYKNYVKRVLTRRNSISGVQYRDEPAIFAWELMNEPRCLSDPSGQTLQAWIKEMADFVKSIDNKHLLTIGHEGFYGPTTPEKFEVNPGNWAQALGVDFIPNSIIDAIDFASVHAYPDSWVPEKELAEKIKYFSKWVTSHIHDGEQVLKKPVLFTEFGLSSQCKDYEASHRDLLLKTMYDQIYESTKKGGAGAGAIVWQFVLEGMEEYGDEFSLIPWKRPSTYNLIIEQSCRLQALWRAEGEEKETLSAACSKLINL